MKKRSSISIGFINLGCAKNTVDSQIMAGALIADGMSLAATPETADVLLVNTCAFIEPARAEAAEAILQACAHKKMGGCKAVIVTGCLPQRYRERAQETFPEVDAFTGVDQLEEIAKIVRRVVAGEKKIFEISKGKANRLYQPRFPTLLFSGGPFAYLKIAEGCNHACAFCAIPGIRGRYRSRKIGDLTQEAAALVKAGVKEINLISQDSASYGRDLRDGSNLAELLKSLDDLDGEFWIRVLYGYPSRITKDLLATMASSRHVLPYLDLPIQHSHPDVLRAMRRADTLKSMENMADRLRQSIPDIVLRTTCIVGFPGETDRHFEHLLEHIKLIKYDHLGVFIYSPEEGTRAFGMNYAIPIDEAVSRQKQLLEVQRKIVAEKRIKLKGQRTKALLIEEVGDHEWIARLSRQAPEVDGVTKVSKVCKAVKPGDFADVEITGGRNYDLTAIVV